jgi:sucrose phosphorylase
MKSNTQTFDKIKTRLKKIYGNQLPEDFSDRFIAAIEKDITPGETGEKWDESDVVLITYGDSIINGKEPGLEVLRRFLNKHLAEELSYVHILPFYPYTSDDGFSVVDYKAVNPELGDWDDVKNLGRDFKLMFDLVINHISQKSVWFQNYLDGKAPGKDYFIEVEPETDLSEVVRPRSLPLLTPFETATGKKHVWTTFSDDQIDLNFSNPEVLLEMVKVLLHYLENGASMIRMDAIAFLWKQIGTTCLHLPQTHEVVKLLRDVMELVNPTSILLTETNVPNKENLSYFGEGDEAHMVYQFSLPPLLLHALFSGNAGYFNQWAASIPELKDNCTFFNFTASHDGIGVRPLEGLLPEDELAGLIEGMKASGGKISTRRKNDGSDSPYEMNITYLDAMKRTNKGTDDLQIDRFLASQTVMMEMKGIPAFYIHSLLGTHNYQEGVEQTGRARTINRRKWEEAEIEHLLENETSHNKILSELKRRINIRKKQPAFNPDGAQEIVDAGNELIAIKRISPDKSQEILCLTNVTDKDIYMDTEDINGFDLLKNKPIDPENGQLVLGPYQTIWLV